jgi:hypothetical protein
MLEKDHFCWLFSLRLALVLDDFVVFCQLDLVGLDHLWNLRFVGFLEPREHLNEVDGHLKDTFRCLDDLLELLGVAAEISVQIDFPSVEAAVALL